MPLKEKLSQLPSVDECLKSPYGEKWLASFYRTIVLRSVREVIDSRRKQILDGSTLDVSINAIATDIEKAILIHSAYKLRPVINASGVVIHTNLGRSILSDRAIKNIVTTPATRYADFDRYPFNRIMPF